jgi:hypothetical protein
MVPAGNVPEPRRTTWPDGHDEMADVICETVDEDGRVVYIVVLFGMPPGTPQLSPHAYVLFDGIVYI